MSTNDENFLKNNWQWFVCMVLLIVFGGLLVYCAWPQKQPALQNLLDELKQQMPPVKEPHIVKQETTASRCVPVCDVWGRIITQPMTTFETSSTTKTSNLPECYMVSKEDMDKILTTVAHTARKDALDEYKENFSILIAILAVFGIAWPAIIAILQLRFNEGELKKIKEAEEKASTANELAKNMGKSMDALESRMNIVFTEQLNAQNAIKELEKIKHDFYEETSLMYGGLATTFIVFSKQNSTTKSIFIPAVVAMYFRQLKYSCKTDASIDDEIESIIDTLDSNITLFESSESKELLAEAWENLDKDLLKSKCTATQYQALEQMCNMKNQNKSGESK